MARNKLKYGMSKIKQNKKITKKKKEVQQLFDLFKSGTKENKSKTPKKKANIS